MALGDLLYTLRNHAKLPYYWANLIDTLVAAAEESTDVTAAQAAADAAQLDATQGIADAAAAQLDATAALADTAVLIDAAIVVAIDDADDVAGGGTTQTVGLQLKDQDGNDLEEVHVLKFGVYDDADGITEGTSATLNTASAGSILAGAGGAVLTVKTSSTGKFTCTLTDASDEAVYLMASAAIRSPILDCRDSDSVTFSA